MYKNVAFDSPAEAERASACRRRGNWLRSYKMSCKEEDVNRR